MSSPGVAPQPTVADGQKQYQSLVDGGFSAQEANQWKLQQTQKLRSGGFSPKEIDDYWGSGPAPTSPQMAAQTATPEQATSLWGDIEAGVEGSATGLAARGKLPDIALPANAGTGSKIVSALAGAATDIPLSIVGAIGGAIGGATAGAAVPGGGETGITEAVGGAAGSGAGAAALPTALRETLIDAYQHGHYANFADFWARFANHIVPATAKAAIAGAIAGPAGEAVGGVAGPLIGKTAASGVNLATQATAFTATGAVLDHKVPDAADFATAAITMLGAHVAGHVIGSRFQTNETAQRVESNLQKIYTERGIPPWQALKRAQTDPQFRQEVIAQDVNGDPVTPAFKQSSPAEPKAEAPKEENVKGSNQNTFTTSKGSTYIVNEDGTTTRNKSYHPEHGAADQGAQPTSEKTYYVTPEDADKLSLFQTQGAGAMAILKHQASGAIGVQFQEGPHAGKFSKNTMVFPKDSPAVGLVPVETWKNGTRVHFGNNITQVSEGAAPKPQVTVESLLPKIRTLEGSGDQAISPKGAIGRFQIMPGTARQYGFDPTRLGEPAYNEQVARHVLADLSRRYPGDEEGILTAYNAGPGVANKFLASGRNVNVLPRETQKYLEHNNALGGGSGEKPPASGLPLAEGGPSPDTRPPMEKNYDTLTSEFLDKVGEQPSNSQWWKPATMYRQFVSELGPARDTDRQLLARNLLDPNKDITTEEMFRQTYGSEQRAGHFIRYGAIDPIDFKKTDDLSLLDVVNKVKDSGGDLDGFNAYRVAARTLEKEQHGIKTGFDPAWAEATVAKGKATYDEANKLMQQWKHGGLMYGQESGLFSAAGVKAMEAANTSHVSMRRVLGDDESFAGGKGKGFKASNPLKRMEGSDRQIIDPMMADIDNLHQIVRMADRNRAVGHVVGAITAEKADVLRLVKLAQPAAELAKPNSDVFEKYHTEAGGFEPFLAQRASKGSLSRNQFLYFRNGAAEVWEAKDPEFASLMRGADSPNEANMLEKVFNFTSRLDRAGIVTSPDYPTRITLRHQVTAFIADPLSPPPFVTWLGGAMHAFKADAQYQDWVAHGGAGTALADMDTNYVQRDIHRIFAETGTYGKMWNLVSHPLEAAQLLSERMDAGARIGYMKRAESQGIDPTKAATMGRKAYLDYVEQGTLGIVKQWASWVPFMRPHILGLKQFGEATTNNPSSTLAKTILAVTAPTMAFYALNYLQDKYGGLPEDQKYQNLPRWQRDTLYILPSVGGVRLRLPYPPVVGIAFGGFVNRMLDHFVENDPHAFDDWSKSFLSEFLPPVIPSVVLPVAEGLANHNFFTGKPLIPDSMAKASPDMQYTEATTAPAKALARVLGSHEGLGIADVSPIVLENYVKSWTGTLGMDALRVLNAPFDTSGKPWDVADIPFVQSFVIRHPGSNAQPIEDFYTDMGKLEAGNEDKFLGLRNNDMSTFAGDSKKAAAYEALVNVRDAIGEMRSTLKGINTDQKMLPAEKQQATDRVYGDMITIAKFGVKTAQSLK